jgi:hypothetical protein
MTHAIDLVPLSRQAYKCPDMHMHRSLTCLIIGYNKKNITAYLLTNEHKFMSRFVVKSIIVILK